MAITRINNNQITDSVAGNIYLGVNAAVKVQDYTITAGKIANNLTYGSDLTITGNLTVQGNTTAIDTINLVVEDPLILLAKEQTGSPALDIGFIGKRGTEDNIAFVWDESADQFVAVFTTSEVTNSTININSYASLQVLDLAAANANITGNLTFSGTILGNVTVSGNLDADNLNATTNVTGTTITASGNLEGGNAVITGDVGSATVTATGNVDGGNLTTAGAVDATGNVAGGNLNTAGEVVATGNVSGGNLTTAGNVDGANVNATSGITAGTTVIATGNVSGSNITTAGNVDGANLNASAGITAGTTVIATGNVSGGNITTAGNVDGANINATADVTATNVIASGNVDGGNVNTDSIVGTAITITGTSVTMDLTGNLSMNGRYINAVADPVAAQDAATKQYVDDAVSAGIHIHTPVDVETPTALPAATYNQGGNLATVTDTIAGNTVVFAAAIDPQVNDQLWFANSFEGIVANIAYFVVSAPNTSAAVLTTQYNGAPVSNITSNTGLTESVRVNSGYGANLTANTNGALTVDGYSVSAGNRVLVYNQSNAVENGIYDVTDAGNVSAPWILTRSDDGNSYIPDSSVGLDEGTYVFVKFGDTGAGEAYVMTAPTGPFNIGQAAVTFTQFSSSQVYSANTSAGLVLNGTVFSAKVDNDTTAFDGGGNIIVKASANLVTPNIGDATGNSLTLTGNGLLSATIVTATGNVSGGNLTTAGDVTTATVTASGNIDGANVNATSGVTAGTTVTATGNVSGGNITTAGAVNATGNVTGGNITTAGAVDATGNVTGGNLNTAGTVVATGNVDGGNVNAASAVTAGTTVTATGNVAGGNITTAGQVAATGNITGGNVVTTGTADLGNIRITGNDITNFASNIITINSAASDIDVRISGDTVANLLLTDAGTDTVVIGGGNATTGAALKVDTTDSMMVPVGNTLQRPGTPEIGMFRFNTGGDALEVYTSSGWEDVGVPAFTVIVADAFVGDGSTLAFTLSANSTTAGTIVSINGIVQEPTTAYSVSGVTLTFTEAPAVSDNIDARILTTTTTVTQIENVSGNAVVEVLDTADTVQITGNLLPQANVTFDLGSTTLRWRDGYFAGNSITLGNTVLKNTTGNSIGFFGPDGSTPATIDAASVDTTQIASGTSSMAVIAADGNIRANVDGNTIQTISTTGVAITGDLSVTGNATLAGNILGDRIQNGTTQIDIQTQDGNANITVGGVSNVAVFSSTGAAITGTLSASGNANVGNLGTAGLIVATGNITGGNLSGTSIIGTLTTAAQTNITSVGTLGSLTVTGNISGGNLITAGLVSLSSITKTGSNGVGNIGSSTSVFDTVFAKATSAQYADLAEMYEADAQYEPGTVLCFGGVKEVTLCGQADSIRVAGVVSTNPSYLMNSDQTGDCVVAVALTGRVPCRVTGTVRKGDLMVSTGDGRARANNVAAVGTVIGKALADFDGADGVIEVVVGRV
jgi:filamentous hemagglutinin